MPNEAKKSARPTVASVQKGLDELRTHEQAVNKAHQEAGAALAHRIAMLEKQLDAAKKLFGENSPTAIGLRQEIAEAMELAQTANKKADKALKITDLLNQRMIEDHDYIVDLLLRVGKLEMSGGSPSSLSALIAAGFTPEERQAIMQLSANTEMSDDEIVAALILGLRSELKGLGDVVAEHSQKLVSHDDGLTSLTGRVNHLEKVANEQKAEMATLSTKVKAIVSGNFVIPLPMWAIGVTVGALAWWKLASVNFPAGSWRHDRWFAPTMGALVATTLIGIMGAIFGQFKASASAELASSSEVKVVPAPAPATTTVNSTMPVPAPAQTST